MPAPARGPVSVVLSDALRRQVAREARKRGLGLSTAMRTLVAERLRDLEMDAELSRGERWQRDQAWASWESALAGDNPPVDWVDVDTAFDRVPKRSRRP